MTPIFDQLRVSRDDQECVTIGTIHELRLVAMQTRTTKREFYEFNTDKFQATFPTCSVLFAGTTSFDDNFIENQGNLTLHERLICAS